MNMNSTLLKAPVCRPVYFYIPYSLTRVSREKIVWFICITETDT